MLGKKYYSFVLGDDDALEKEPHGLMETKLYGKAFAYGDNNSMDETRTNKICDAPI